MFRCNNRRELLEMKIEEYYLDFKLSEKVYNSNKNLLEIGKCYNNIFNIITCRELVSEDIKIAYGFVYRKDLPKRAHRACAGFRKR